MKTSYRFASFLLFLTCFVSQSLFAAASQKELKKRMLSDLDAIQSFFEVKYAPLEFKKEFANLDLDVEFTNCRAKLDALPNPTIKDFQIALKEVLASIKDYHVNVHYFSTEQAFLPFTVKGADGHYFISYIDRAKAPTYIFPFEVGDEIITFGGEPIENVIAEVKKRELGNNSPDTDQSLAELLLTARRGDMGHQVPRGGTQLQIKRKVDGKIKGCLAHWDYTPEKIKDLGLIKPSAFMPKATYAPDLSDLVKIFEDTKIFEKMMVHSMFGKNYIKSIEGTCNPHLIGAKKSFLPSLGKVVWQASKDLHFDAYIFDACGGKKIGYIRISHYMCDENEAKEFQDLINSFQKRTDALIIDQLNNSGGSLFYVYALASMLTDRPLETPKHRIALTQEEVYVAVALLPLMEMIQSDADAKAILGENIGGYPVSMDTIKNLRRFFNFVIEEWNSGHLLTRPTFVLGFDQINPSIKGRYTKPIVILINELDFSCGDFMPAILKDNNRATLIGTRTAGAGGYVLSVNFPNHVGIESLNLTGSIAERLDHSPLENYGVQPDIVHTVTTNDLQNNYSEFINTILTNLETIIRKNPK